MSVDKPEINAPPAETATDDLGIRYKGPLILKLLDLVPDPPPTPPTPVVRPQPQPPRRRPAPRRLVRFNLSTRPR